MSSRDGSKRQLFGLLSRAFRGDRRAVLGMVQRALPMYRGKVENLRREIEHRQDNVWDYETPRERCLGDGPDFSAEETLAAFSQIHRGVLRLTHRTPVLLAGPAEAAELHQGRWIEAARSLLLTLHNPAIVYPIVGGFREELREDVLDYLARMNAELWGTLEAVVLEDELHAENFPPETRALLEQVAASAAEQSGAGAGGD